MSRPPARLTVDDITQLNKRVLIETAFEGDRPHGVQNAAGLLRATAIANQLFLSDPHRRATLLCCALIANHPFNDGNHRTSLHAATLLLLMDGWFYNASVEEEKEIYNWRFDHEEAHDLEATWSRQFGGWDIQGEQAYLLALLDGEYGQRIERFLRTHTERIPMESVLLLLPPRVYAANMKSFPGGAWKKEVNRKRRALASSLRPTWAHYEKLLADQRPDRVAKPQKHWRPEKL